VIRISRLADYGVVLLGHMVRRGGDGPVPARDLAEVSGVPAPTVAKILKSLTRAGILSAQRARHGGYRLARPPEQISVTEVLAALDSPVSITVCCAVDSVTCQLSATCPGRDRWHAVNQVIHRSLGNLTLSEMVSP
jgi:FeS assembly SUF system regulator